jgi:hypothetical protein
VPYWDIPWPYIQSKHEYAYDRYSNALQGLRGLPKNTKLELNDWVRYLAELVRYLNTVLRKEEGYQILHAQYTTKEDPTMTERDAGVFIDSHFPEEGRRLKDDSSKLSLIGRATTFAYRDKTLGDIREKCNDKWLIFIYYLLKGKFPTKNIAGEYEEAVVIKTILQTNIDWKELGLHEEAPDIRHLLTSPAHLVWSFLKENHRARQLYGNSVDTATVGVHRMMVVGVLIRWYMEKMGSSDIDDHIKTCELNFILWARGALQSSRDQPRFYSQCIPIYTEETVLAGVTAIIKAEIPVALVPPRNVIHQNMTSDDYQQYYMDKIEKLRQGTTENEISNFSRFSHHEQNLAVGPCLFPQQSGHMSDWSRIDTKGYLYQEGKKMVALARGIRHKMSTSSSSSSSDSGPQTWHPPSEPRMSSIRTSGQPSQASSQPRIITLAQLQANRDKRIETEQYSEYVESSEYSLRWSEYTAQAEESEYLRRMEFWTISIRELRVGDSLVLLSRNRKRPRDSDDSIMNMAHVQYRVDHINVTKVRVQYIIVLHDDTAHSNIREPIPAKMTITVDDQYILWKKRPVSSSNLSALLEAREEPVQTGEWTRSSRPAARSSHIDDDTRSVESDGRKHSKTTFITVGNAEVEVLGKHAVHDNILQSTMFRALSEKDQLRQFLAAAGFGYFGNNYTAANILQGMIKYDSATTEATTLCDRLHARVNHNKIAVLRQAWYKHEALHSKIVLCEFEQGYATSAHSIHCAHLLPEKVAAEDNYDILNWKKWLLHMEGWKQLFQELLGQPYGDTLQRIISEATEKRIGELNNVVYLVQLTLLWRSDITRLAKSTVPFTLSNSSEIFVPSDMNILRWQEVIEIQWKNFQGDLDYMDQFKYLQSLKARNIELPKAYGHKGRNVQPGEEKPAGAKGLKEQEVPKRKKLQDKGKKPSPQKDNGANLCVADLLNQYGSKQQIVCEAPCKYPHYNAIAKGVTKAAVIKKVQFLAPRLQLTEGTVGFLKRKIDSDVKFK